MPEFSTTPQLKGAGLYGDSAETHVTSCVNSKNPAGHNRECPCDWWARKKSAERTEEVKEARRFATFQRLIFQAREQDLKDQSVELIKKRRKKVTVKAGIELVGEQMRLNEERSGFGV